MALKTSEGSSFVLGKDTLAAPRITTGGGPTGIDTRGPPTEAFPLPPPSALAKPFTVGAVRPGLPRTALPPQLYFFNDLNRRFQQTSNALVVTGVEALNQDIDNILECPVRSFMFNRGFGCQIKSILFDPMNELTANRLKILFIEAIRRWEPRLRLDFQNSMVVPYPDLHLYVAFLVYRVLSTNQIGTYVRALPTQVGT